MTAPRPKHIYRIVEVRPNEFCIEVRCRSIYSLFFLAWLRTVYSFKTEGEALEMATYFIRRDNAMLDLPRVIAVPNDRGPVTLEDDASHVQKTFGSSFFGGTPT